MTIKHFCHICNVKFQRAVDFISHKHKDSKPIVKEEENDRV